MMVSVAVLNRSCKDGFLRIDKEIYLVRHGETEWNQQQRLQGRMDSPLTDLGRKQSERLGWILAAHLGTRHHLPMYVSPLPRTRQTAAIIRQYALGPEPIFEPRIQEISLGAWEGLTSEDVEARWPDLVDGYDEMWWFRAPGGERYEEFKARVAQWLGELTTAVIAVSHGITGRLIRGAVLGLPPSQALLLPSPQDVVWHMADHKIEALSL
jgi:probable phosphoglycerate mutase